MRHNRPVSSPYVGGPGASKRETHKTDPTSVHERDRPPVFRQFIHGSFSSSVSPFVRPSVRPRVRPSIRSSVGLSVLQPVRPSVRPSLRSSRHLLFLSFRPSSLLILPCDSPSITKQLISFDVGTAISSTGRIKNELLDRMAGSCVRSCVGRDGDRPVRSVGVDDAMRSTQ